eukprot:SAG11_NODE_2102_length_3820_cov_2.233808_5_plen_79_part_00
MAEGVDAALEDAKAAGGGGAPRVPIDLGRPMASEDHSQDRQVPGYGGYGAPAGKNKNRCSPPFTALTAQLMSGGRLLL